MGSLFFVGVYSPTETPQQKNRRKTPAAAHNCRGDWIGYCARSCSLRLTPFQSLPLGEDYKVLCKTPFVTKSFVAIGRFFEQALHLPIATKPPSCTRRFCYKTLSGRLDSKRGRSPELAGIPKKVRLLPSVFICLIPATTLLKNIRPPPMSSRCGAEVFVGRSCGSLLPDRNAPTKKPQENSCGCS